MLAIMALLLKKVRVNSAGKPETDPGGKPFGFVLPSVLTTVFCIFFVVSGWMLKSVSSVNTCPERMSFESFPMEIGEWKGKRSYLSKEIMDSLWADDYVSAAYYKDGSMNMIHLLIPFYEYQKTRHTAHAPQSCLIGGGWTLLMEDEHLIKPDAFREVKIKVMIMKKDDTAMLASYFFFGRGRVVTNPWINKFHLMRDAITQGRITWDGIIPGRTDGSLVRVELVAAPGQSADDAYVQLEEFISHLWPFLSRYVPL